MNRGILHYSRIPCFFTALERVGRLITLRFLFLSSRQKRPYSPLVAPDSSDGEEEMTTHSVAEQKTS